MPMKTTLLVFAALLWPAAGHAADLLSINRRTQISRADLLYDSPATRPEEGMPIGNGRTGSLVWTTPSALHFQINRVDVHAMDSTTASFPRADSDFGYGCGSVDIHVADSGEDQASTTCGIRCKPRMLFGQLIRRGGKRFSIAVTQIQWLSTTRKRFSA